MRYRIGAACVMDAGTSSEVWGVVSRTPYKGAGEWWIEVTAPSEKNYTNGYRSCEATRRYPKRRVTQLRGRK